MDNLAASHKVLMFSWQIKFLEKVPGRYSYLPGIMGKNRPSFPGTALLYSHYWQYTSDLCQFPITGSDI